jgi:hypothetical protein
MYTFSSSLAKDYIFEVVKGQCCVAVLKEEERVQN